MPQLGLLITLLREIAATGAFTVETPPSVSSNAGAAQERALMIRTVVQLDADIIQWVRPSALDDPALLREHQEALMQRLEAFKALHRGMLSSVAMFGGLAAFVTGAVTWFLGTFQATPSVAGMGVSWLLMWFGGGAGIVGLALPLARGVILRLFGERPYDFQEFTREKLLDREDALRVTTEKQAAADVPRQT